MKQLCLDIGYSSTKVKYNGKLYKFPTAISYSADLGISYGEDDIIKYNGESYYVGEAAVGLESFTTTDWGFKRIFDPIIVYHVLKKLELVNIPILIF